MSDTGGVHLRLMLFALLGDPQASRAGRAGGPPPKDTFFSTPLPAAEIQQKQAVLDTSAGVIVLDLLADAAPLHVSHFITRAREGTYNGTAFHRVIAMGIIQGGDPLSKDPAQAAKYGTGGLGVLRFEPNAEKHSRGAVSAVLVPGNRDSAGTQFFISVSDQPALDGQYTEFARVAEGIAVAQKISTVAAAETVPAERIEIRGVTIRDKPAPRPRTWRRRARSSRRRWARSRWSSAPTWRRTTSASSCAWPPPASTTARRSTAW